MFRFEYIIYKCRFIYDCFISYISVSLYVYLLCFIYGNFGV